MENQKIIWKDRKRTLFGLPLSFTKYSLEEDRLFIETGFFNSVENEVRLYRIMDLQLSRTLGQKMFGLGTIKVKSADKTLGDFEIKNIKDSENVKNQLSDLIEEARRSNRVSSREFMTEPEDDDEVGEEE